jgi:hypothetical protein
MVNRRLWMGALGVAAILLIASVIYVLVTPPEPQPSVAVQMALIPSDLGTNWSGDLQDMAIPVITDDSSIIDNTTSRSRNILWNGTYQYSYQIEIWLVCWKDSLNANHAFEKSLGYGQEGNVTFVNVTLGDKTYLYYLVGYRIYLDFLQGNIECWLYADGQYGGWGMPWWIDTTIWIAQLQLEKIDQYRAQHPGVS